MLFIETQTFTRLITSLLSDDEYAGLPAELADAPERGNGHLRKLAKEL